MRLRAAEIGRIHLHIPGRVIHLVKTESGNLTKNNLKNLISIREICCALVCFHKQRGGGSYHILFIALQNLP